MCRVQNFAVMCEESVYRWIEKAEAFDKEPCVGVDGSIAVSVEEVYLTGRVLFDASSMAAAVALPLTQAFGVFNSSTPNPRFMLFRG